MAANDDVKGAERQIKHRLIGKVLALQHLKHEKLGQCGFKQHQHQQRTCEKVHGHMKTLKAEQSIIQHCSLNYAQKLLAGDSTVPDL
jgi:hypothetical protein